MAHMTGVMTRSLAAAATLALTLAPSAGGPVTAGANPAEGDAGYSKTQNVMSLANSDGVPGRLYVTNQFTVSRGGDIVDYVAGNSGDGSMLAAEYKAVETGKTTQERVKAGQRVLPWSVSIAYGLNGPQVKPSQIAGASGLVDIRITVEPNAAVSNGYAENSIPVVAFTVPSSVSDDITVGDGMTLTMQGSDMLVSGVGEPGKRTVFDCYMNAKNFSMSQLAFVTVQADDTASFVDEVTAVSDRADALVNTLVVTGSASDRKLIEQLTAMRDREQKLGEKAIKEKTAAHKAAFSSYMAHYVGSYTTHLSGSIGSSTQMQALIGTAGELTGDTPMAQAVTDLANAVNAVSAAHEHDGAVHAIDDLIQRIRQRGTSGLADEISQTMAQESTEGATAYKAGQSQLSNAMIPYSMAYTDVYTKHLSELTGGTSAGAARYQQQAIDAANEEFSTSADLQDDNQKVQSAMDALAAASEHTGAANALQQISIQFAGALTSTASTLTSTASTGDAQGGDAAADRVRYGWAGSDTTSMAAKAERKRLAAVSKQEREEAERKAQALASGKTDDDSQSGMSIGDVMGNASGLGMLGGAVKSDGKGGNKDSGDGKDGNASGSGSSSATGTASGSKSASVPKFSPVYGIAGMNPRSPLQSTSSELIDETVAIGDVSDMLVQAAQSLAGSGSGSASVDGKPVARLAAALRRLSCDGANAYSDHCIADGRHSYDVLSDWNRHTEDLRLLIIMPAV
mgnify:CR=1 FL=1